VSETVTFTTCRDRRQAAAIAKTLVREKLAACVNLVPNVSSIYSWKGRIEEGREVLLVIKSRAALSKRLAARIRRLHSYEVPEVVTLRIASGNADYLRWIRESTR
jgi:periplasmic divalent cation tolerance protein